MMVIKRVFVWFGISLLFVGCIGPGANRSDSLIVIDAGHGGHDCGALCGGKQEKDLVLQITKRLQKEFRSQGVQSLYDPR